LAAGTQSPSELLQQQESLRRLRHALEELPAAQRTVFELRVLEGRPIDAIAQAMGRTVTSVAGLLRRGRAAVRLRMEAE
jgi:RNA polymerase sigma factor (sigma-70 family)